MFSTHVVVAASLHVPDDSSTSLNRLGTGARRIRLVETSTPTRQNRMNKIDGHLRTHVHVRNRALLVQHDDEFVQEACLA